MCIFKTTHFQTLNTRLPTGQKSHRLQRYHNSSITDHIGAGTQRQYEHVQAIQSLTSSILSTAHPVLDKDTEV